MSRQTITSDGVVYRTKLFKDARVDAFAACLRSNSRFQDVEIRDAMRGIGKFITFKPVNTERQGDMLQREWDSREQRGQNEGMDYIFLKADRGNFWWCYNPLSMETYEVSHFECSCPDYQYRCKKVAIQCKHQQAWEAQSRAGVLGKEKEEQQKAA